MKNTKTFYGIEILRFISALAILIWHYQHFYFLGDQDLVTENQPFYNLFKLFYIYGFQGVNFFWCISGFIFFWKYADKVKSISAYQFFKIRFARLYPLHFATLIIVVILQYFYFIEMKEIFLNHKNDLYHFFLQIFMASYWGFEDGHSFNSAIWSISIEILVYIFFYILLKTFGASTYINFFIIGICIILKALLEYNAHVFFDCSLFFFVGGLIALNMEIINKIKFIKILTILTIISTSALVMKYQLLKINNFPYVFQLFTYPLLLILFLDLEFKNKNLKKMLSVLGNLTYSSYLIHLPIQIIICLIFINIEQTIPVEEKEFFLLYISLVLFISYFSFKYYESPIRDYLRKNM